MSYNVYNIYSIRNLGALLYKLKIVSYYDSMRDTSLCYSLERRIDKIKALKELKGYEQKIAEVRKNRGI
jgi:hypothetical protein